MYYSTTPLASLNILPFYRHLTLNDLDLEGHLVTSVRLPMQARTFCIQCRYLTLGDLDLDFQGHLHTPNRLRLDALVPILQTRTKSVHN